MENCGFCWPFLVPYLFFLVLVQIKFKKCKPLPRVCNRTLVYILILILGTDPELGRCAFRGPGAMRLPCYIFPSPHMVASYFCSLSGKSPSFKYVALCSNSFPLWTYRLSFLLGFNHLKIFLLLLKVQLLWTIKYYFYWRRGTVFYRLLKRSSDLFTKSTKRS